MSTTIFSEIFPIVAEKLPQFYAYEMRLRNESATSIGRRLSDRLERQLAGHWIWTDGVLITNVQPTDNEINELVKSIRANEPDVFRHLIDVRHILDWYASPESQAVYVAFGAFNQLRFKISDILKPYTLTLGSQAKVERDYSIKSWVVHNTPAISISIKSNVIFNQDLNQYIMNVGNTDNLEGIWVADKVPYTTGKIFKGSIQKVIGGLGDEMRREELLDLAKREGTRTIISQAQEGETIVQIGEYGDYYYVASGLNIILFPEHYRRFGINTRQAQRATWIKPGERTKVVASIADLGKTANLIDDAFTSEQNTDVTRKMFYPAKKYQYNDKVEIGNNQVVNYRGQNVVNSIRQHGLYNHSTNVGTNVNPLKIGVINPSSKSIDPLVNGIKNSLEDLHQVLTDTTVTEIGEINRIQLERAVQRLLDDNVNFIIAILPKVDSYKEEDWSAYLDFKSIVMDVVPNQVIDSNTLDRDLQWVMPNLAMGIVAKLGNIPYALANPIDYADIVVGIDIARMKTKGGGSRNVSALAQVYQKNGQFIKCRVIETPLSGETVPPQVLRSLFPLNEFENKTVVVHRDGIFRGNEKEIITEHMQQLGGQAYLVEVIKSGSPRVFQHRKGNGIGNPPLGTAVVLNNEEAILVSTSSKTATVSPIRLRTQDPFTIGKALHSTLMLTLLHFGSLRRPKTPVTIHFSDKVGYLALRGVKPRNNESNELYWL